MTEIETKGSVSDIVNQLSHVLFDLNPKSLPGDIYPIVCNSVYEAFYTEFELDEKTEAYVKELVSALTKERLRYVNKLIMGMIHFIDHYPDSRYAKQMQDYPTPYRRS